MRLCNVNTICPRTFLPAGEVAQKKGPRCPDNGPVGKLLLLLAVLSIVTTAASQNMPKRYGKCPERTSEQ